MLAPYPLTNEQPAGDVASAVSRKTTLSAAILLKLRPCRACYPPAADIIQSTARQIRQPEPIVDRRAEIEFRGSGVAALAFTFG